MFLFTKTAVIKSDLQQILLLMCFSAYLINQFNFLCKILIILLYIGYMHKLNYWFCGSNLKKQESPSYIRPTDLDF